MSAEPAPPRRRRRRPFTGTAVALLVAAGLGAYLWFVESKREPGKEGEPKEKLVALGEDQKVKALELRPAGGEAVKLARDGEAWRITEPIAAAAASTEVEALVSSLKGLEVEEVVVESGAALADFGLEPPARVVTVEPESGSPIELHLGARTPDGASVYARLASQPRVVTVPSWAEASLDKKAFDLRDRDVLKVARDDIRAVQVEGPGTAWKLVRGEGDGWSFTAPIATQAGRWSVDSLLGTLDSLRFESVAAEEAPDGAAWGLDVPAWTVTLEMADGSTTTLEISGKAEGDRPYARVAGSTRVVTIAPALVDDLRKGMGELRAKRLLDVATFEVTGLGVERPGEAPRQLGRSTRVDEEGVPIYDWSRTAPDAAKVETNTVQDALFLVGGVEAQEFLDEPEEPAAYGLAAPALRVRIDYEDKPDVEFEVGEIDGAFFARRSGDTAVLKLAPEKARELIEAFSKL